MPSVLTSEKFIFNVHNFEDESGIHSEKIGNLQYFVKKWNLITYIDLEPYIKNSEIIENGIQDLKKYCINSQNESCFNLKEINLIENRQKSTINSQREIIGMLHTNTRRYKRSLLFFNYVGKFNRMVFGNLDEDDKQEIDNHIDILANSDREILTMIRKQTQIVKNKFLRTQDVIQSLDTDLNITKNIVNIHINKIYSEIHDLEKIERIISTTSLLGRYTSEQEVDTELLTNAILFAKEGNIHPKLFQRKDLLSIIDMIKLDQTDVDFPITDNPTISDVSKISEIKVYFSNFKLVYVIEIPLVTKESFELWRHYSIPIHQKFPNSKIYAYIKPSDDYVALSINKDKYMQLSNDNLNRCKKIESKFICQAHPIYDINENNPCEIKILAQRYLSDENINNCNIKIKQMYEPFFKNLDNDNTWLFSTNKKILLTIICNHTDTYHTYLQKAGILQLQQNCIGRTNHITLNSVATVNQFRNFSYTNPINLNLTNLLKKNLNFGKTNYLEIFNISHHKYNLFTHTENLNEAESLDDIIALAKDQNEKNILQEKITNIQKSSSYSTIIIGISITILLTLYILNKLKLLNFKRNATTNPTVQIINKPPPVNVNYPTMPKPTPQTNTHHAYRLPATTQQKSQVTTPKARNNFAQEYINPSFTQYDNDKQIKFKHKMIEVFTEDDI